jgi:deoxyribonuclease V
VEDLEAEQLRLAAARPSRFDPSRFVADRGTRSIAGSFVCFGRGGAGPGSAGDTGWAAAALFHGTELAALATVRGNAGAGYDPGHLALREGPLHEAALLALPERPAVLLVDATGRDHPRRAGLALHLGARLDVPTVGVTNRLLVATGALPPGEPGSRTPIELEGELVGFWLRVRRGVRPLAIHAAWRTDAETALAIVQACIVRARTPEPLRAARRAARETRARDAMAS